MLPPIFVSQFRMQMNSRQKLIEDIRKLSPSEVLLMQNWLLEVKRTTTKAVTKKKGAEQTRMALSSIDTSLSKEVSDMREDRQ